MIRSEQEKMAVKKQTRRERQQVVDGRGETGVSALVRAYVKVAASLASSLEQERDHAAARMPVAAWGDAQCGAYV